MEKLKLFLRIWFIKYWYLLVLCLSTAFGVFYYLETKDYQDVYICRMQGSTYVVSRYSINEYLAPLAESLKQKDYATAEQILGLKSDILKKITVELYDADAIVEEQYIRYEYIITITTTDTTDLYKLEDAYARKIMNHPLVKENYKVKVKKFAQEKQLIEADVRRVDSTAALMKGKTAEYEVLMQKKVDLKLQLAKLQAKFDENYLHKKIYGFHDSCVKMERNPEEQRVSLLKWFSLFFLLDFVIVFLINRDFRQIFFT
ncbi:MAG: hypothetical protein ACKOXB_04060 [Flavobacteriales bacterium]